MTACIIIISGGGSDRANGRHVETPPEGDFKHDELCADDKFSQIVTDCLNKERAVGAG